jgi:aminoglycoside/choline kinase family phosphotransferase
MPDFSREHQGLESRVSLAIAPEIQQFLAHDGFEHFHISFAGSAGSQRLYYRVRPRLTVESEAICPSYILLVSPQNETADLDFDRFARITDFYQSCQFSVPKIFCVAKVERQILLEDLGSMTLHNRLQDCSLKKIDRLQWYYKALDMVQFLQVQCTEQRSNCMDIVSRSLDFQGLRWETQYFTENYLEQYRGVRFSEEDREHLYKQYDLLAEKVAHHPQVIVHRDLQSQNLMVVEEGLRVIDYQGSRMGSCYYDVASLLLDPYTMLSQQEIEVLFTDYHCQNSPAISLEKGFLSFWEAGAQRIMQALGAYCYLSRAKGLTEFEQYIKPGEKRLQWVLKQLDLELTL